MATDEAVAPNQRGWSRTLSLINPLRAVWWLFTNVRFAIALLAVLTVVSLLGVLIPQVPPSFRGDVLSESMWLKGQEGTFGFLTHPMDTLGLFDIFHQRWFALLLGMTVASTAAYLISRFPGVVRTITRPRRRVPDRYFDLAPHSFKSSAVVAPEALALALRSRRYKVKVDDDGDTTYLIADRLQWAALGTFLTHAAVIVFILSAVVSRVDAFSSQLFLAEGTTQPIFAVSDPEQMQVELLDSYSEFAADGQPLDYRSDLVIYERGEEAIRCSSTVNSPCGYDGYRFHQSAYFGYGAQLEVRDPASGNLLFGETLALSQRTPSPRVRITAANGDVIFDRTVLLTDAAKANGEEFRAGLVRADNGSALTFWQPAEGGDLIVFEPSGADDSLRASVSPGKTVESGGYEIAYPQTDQVPSIVAEGVPLPGEIGGGNGEVLLLMENVVYGTGNTSAGDDNSIPPTRGEPRLTIVGLQAQPLSLTPGETATIDGMEYRFGGQREFSGIDVRRDRSDNLVWIGADAIVVGLMITFWVPRRRLWAKINAAGMAMAGQAPWHAQFGRELRDIAVAAGANIEETDNRA
jgi:cytochrome c biogenesis protein